VIVGLLDRHAARDWGDLDAEDRAANDSDHTHAEGRLFSSYDTPEHGAIWVITEDLRGEADGPITTAADQATRSRPEFVLWPYYI
jgi:hypothetical protein